MAKINGIALRGTLKFIKEKGYAIPLVLGELRPETQLIFKHPIVAGSWYPYEAYRDLIVAVDRQVGRGDGSLMPEMGHFAARQDAGTVFKVLSLFVSVEKTLPWADRLWGEYCDTGTFVTETKTGWSRTELQGFPGIHPGHCEVLGGWFTEMCLVLKASSSEVEHPRCVSRGDPTCEFIVRWT